MRKPGSNPGLCHQRSLGYPILNHRLAGGDNVGKVVFISLHIGFDGPSKAPPTAPVTPDAMSNPTPPATTSEMLHNVPITSAEVPAKFRAATA